MAIELPDSASCLGCGYSLRGLPEAVCPECGRAFIPDDPTTYKDGKARIRWPFLPTPPPGWHAIALAVAAAYVLYASSEPGTPAFLGLACVVMLLGPVAVAVLVIEYVGRIVAVRADRERRALDRPVSKQGGRWRWAVLPLFLALLLSVLHWSWPLRLRFHLSRPSFEQAVERVQAGAASATLGGRIGLYEVRDIHVYGSGDILFRTGGSPFDDDDGFIYLSDDTPTWTRQMRLARCWYLQW